MSAAMLSINAGESYIACRLAKVPGGRRAVTALSADETRTLINKAKFLPALMTRTSYFLARDDDATYYYVDRLQPEYGGNGFRVFVGPTGAMKQVALSNIASDTVGEIYATKDGKLKITNGKEPAAAWIKGGKKTELTVVPVYENRYLIYRGLGIYGGLGVVCDDQ
jgi:hypothetical protein